MKNKTKENNRTLCSTCENSKPNEIDDCTYAKYFRSLAHMRGGRVIVSVNECDDYIKKGQDKDPSWLYGDDECQG